MNNLLPRNYVYHEKFDLKVYSVCMCMYAYVYVYVCLCMCSSVHVCNVWMYIFVCTERTYI